MGENLFAFFIKGRVNWIDTGVDPQENQNDTQRRRNRRRAKFGPVMTTKRNTLTALQLASLPCNQDPVLQEERQLP